MYATITRSRSVATHNILHFRDATLKNRVNCRERLGAVILGRSSRRPMSLIGSNTRIEDHCTARELPAHTFRDRAHDANVIVALRYQWSGNDADCEDRDNKSSDSEHADWRRSLSGEADARSRCRSSRTT